MKNRRTTMSSTRMVLMAVVLIVLAVAVPIGVLLMLLRDCLLCGWNSL